jgi:hypothetical protein
MTKLKKSILRCDIFPAFQKSEGDHSREELRPRRLLRQPKFGCLRVSMQGAAGRRRLGVRLRGIRLERVRLNGRSLGDIARHHVGSGVIGSDHDWVTKPDRLDPRWKVKDRDRLGGSCGRRAGGCRLTRGGSIGQIGTGDRAVLVERGFPRGRYFDRGLAGGGRDTARLRLRLRGLWSW